MKVENRTAVPGGREGGRGTLNYVPGTKMTNAREFYWRLLTLLQVHQKVEEIFVLIEAVGNLVRGNIITCKVVKRSGLSPNFNSELISFDIVEPQDFIVAGDVSLSVELWDDNAWADDLLASVELSALR